MSTAATPINESGPLEFYLPPEANSKYYVYMHFAELVKLKANQSRSFNITLNGELWYDGTVVPSYLFTNTLFSPSALTGGNYVFSIFKTENSTLPPIINAIEIYTVKHFPQSETDKQDGMLFVTQVCIACYIYIYQVISHSGNNLMSK